MSRSRRGVGKARSKSRCLSGSGTSARKERTSPRPLRARSDRSKIKKQPRSNLRKFLEVGMSLKGESAPTLLPGKIACLVAKGAPLRSWKTSCRLSSAPPGGVSSRERRRCRQQVGRDFCFKSRRRHNQANVVKTLSNCTKYGKYMMICCIVGNAVFSV